MGNMCKQKNIIRQDMIAYCGVNCAGCSDYMGGVCPGCRATDWKEGSTCLPVECCRKKGISFCGECAGFPCADMRGFYRESESHTAAYSRMLALRAQEKTKADKNEVRD